MRVSKHWLDTLVPTGWDLETLCARLTMAGFEVEGTAPVAGAFDSVVVGRVLSCVPHPSADRLKVTTVDVGDGAPRGIVCGASNVRAGLTVAVALEGATLPGGVRIKRATLRGVESAGMLCSGRELGIGDDAEGLLELDPSLVLGTDLRRALDLDDSVIEINFTPNRGDALSVRGLARELAVMAGVPVVEAAVAAVPVTLDDGQPVRLAAAGVGRFLGRLFQGLDPAARTPLWMRERLRRAGLRSLGPLVDVTNYVMLETGQPMHAYDRRALDGEVVVRLASVGETLTLLDGRRLELGPDVLVIADRTGPLGLAGVMGGEKSGIAPDTTDAFLEVAWFAPAAIAGRARRYGLVTDASQRFERGVDPTLQERAMARASELLLAIAGGAAGPVSVAEAPAELPVKKVITLREKSIKRLIGIDIPSETSGRILAALGLVVAAVPDGYRVTVPSWRFDLSLEADLIEEIARVYGYNEIPDLDQPAPVRPRALAEARVGDERYGRTLIERGYDEVLNYTFVEPGFQARLFPEADTLTLANPLSADLATMRVSLWPGLVRTWAQNARRQQDRGRCFEIGARFTVHAGRLTERPTLAGLAAGRVLPEQWGATPVTVDFFDVKGDVEALLALSGRGAEYRFEAATLPCLHPGRSACIRRGDVTVGYLGELHPSLVPALELPGAVVLFELDLNVMNESQLPQANEISRFPHLRRDLAVVVDESTTFNELRESVTVSAAGLLTELKVFDVYRGKGIETGRKSVALGLILQETSRTLTDAEADAVIARVTQALQRDLNAVLRD